MIILTACAPGGAATSTPLPGGDLPDSSGGAAGAGESTEGNASDASRPEDSATGLLQPPLAPPPPGAAAAPSGQDAAPTGMIWIGGDQPLVLSGGECQRLDNDIYLSVPIVDYNLPPYASLVIYEGTSPTRQGTLVWATSEDPTDGAVVSTQDIFSITLNPDGFSGSFEGTAHRTSSGVPVQELITVRGVFTCVATVIVIRGDHPLQMAEAQCSLDPSLTLRVGERGGNQALLLTEEGTGPGDSARGGLSWRVGGVNYVSQWLTVMINLDGLSGTYHGEAAGPDGEPFFVVGAFNCLGG